MENEIEREFAKGIWESESMRLIICKNPNSHHQKNASLSNALSYILVSHCPQHNLSVNPLDADALNLSKSKSKIAFNSRINN